MDTLKNIDWKTLENAMDAKAFGEYLSSLCSDSCDEFYRVYCRPFKNPDRIEDREQKMLKAFTDNDVTTAIRSVVFEADGQVSPRFRDQGISTSLCDYYLSVLADPLRAFLYKTKLYPFFLQDVEYAPAFTYSVTQYAKKV